MNFGQKNIILYTDEFFGREVYMGYIKTFDEFEKIEIIIADADAKRAKQTAYALEEYNKIKIKRYVQDGKSTLEEIMSGRYDAAVICLSLIGNDGIWVLEELKKINLKSIKIIVINNFNNPKFSEIAINLGADYCISEPFDSEIIGRRIIQLCEKERENNGETVQTQKKAGSAKISEMIGKFGIRPSLKGYSYLKFAIPYILENRYVMDAITKELYPEIARKFNTQPKSVERDIRHCIDISWKTSANKYNETFGYEFKKRPTNKEFIHAIIDYITENNF